MERIQETADPFVFPARYPHDLEESKFDKEIPIPVS
jgi:hypothetical protein